VTPNLWDIWRRRGIENPRYALTARCFFQDQCISTNSATPPASTHRIEAMPLILQTSKLTDMSFKPLAPAGLLQEGACWGLGSVCVGKILPTRGCQPFQRPCTRASETKDPGNGHQTWPY